MDYNFRCSTVRIDPWVRLCRNIALIDMLRTISRDIPDDAAILYLFNNDQSGLSDIVMSRLRSWIDDNYKSTSSIRQIGRNLAIPDGVRTMANEFLLSVIIDELYNILESDFSSLSKYEGSVATVKVYPLAVRNALNQAYFTSGATIQDHRDDLSVLRATICNDAINVTAKNSHVVWEAQKRWEDQKFDVLTESQQKKVSCLKQMAYEAIIKMSHTRKLAAPYDLEGLLDLLEVVLMFRHPNGYIEASNAFAVHQYAKLAEVGGQFIPTRETSHWAVGRLKDLHRAKVNAAVDMYTRLSPQAVLLMGRNSRMWLVGCCSEEGDNIGIGYYYANALKSYLCSRPQSTTNVAAKLFVKQEVAISLLKMESLSADIRRHQNETSRCCGYAPDNECDCVADNPVGGC